MKPMLSLTIVAKPIYVLTLLLITYDRRDGPNCCKVTVGVVKVCHYIPCEASAWGHWSAQYEFLIRQRLLFLVLLGW